MNSETDNLRRMGEKARAEAERIARFKPSALPKLYASFDRTDREHEDFVPWSCWARGTGEFLRGRPALALPLLRKAAHVFRCTGDQHSAARVDIALMDALACVGQHRGARKCGLRALEEFEKTNDIPRRASILLNLGGLADARDQIRSAHALWLKADALIDNDDFNRRAAVEGNLAGACLALGRFHEALKHYDKAGRLYRALGAETTSLKAELGAIETRAMLGELGPAIDQTERIVEQASKLEDDDLLFEGMSLLARFELDIGHVTRAAEIADDVVDRSEANGRWDDTARCAVIRALAVARGADFDVVDPVEKAEKALERAGLKVAGALMRIELARADGSVTGVECDIRADIRVVARAGLTVQADLGRVVLARRKAFEGDRRQAFHLCEKVLSGRQISVWPSIEAHAAIADIIRDEDQKGAIAHLRSAVRKAESIRGRLACERDRNAFTARVKAVYEALVSLLLERGGAYSRRAAFDLVARVKSRALLEAIDRRRDLEWSNQPELVAQWNQLRSELSAMLSALEANQDDETRYATSAIHSRVRSLSKGLNDLEISLARADPRFGALFDGGRNPAVGRLLRPGEVLAEFYFSGDDLVLFDLRRSGLEVRVLPKIRTRVEALVDTIRFHLSKVAYGRKQLERPGTLLVNQARAHLQALGDLILESIFRRGAPAALILAPAGCLHHLPWAALEVGGRPIIESSEVSVVPSARVLARILQRPVLQPLTMGIAGGIHNGLSQLSSEIAAISEIFPHAEVKEHAGITEVKRLLTTCDMVHVACHGAFQPLFPSGSGVRLRDGWFTAFDVLQLAPKARIVSLGSCSSGQVKVDPGEELMGVVRALLECGVDTLLLAPGILDDTVASEAAQIFYQNLNALGPGAALQTSMLRMRQQYPHPALWASFQLYGNQRGWAENREHQ